MDVDARSREVAEKLVQEGAISIDVAWVAAHCFKLGAAEQMQDEYRRRADEYAKQQERIGANYFRK